MTTLDTMQWAGKTWIVLERVNQARLVRDTDPVGNQRLWLLPETTPGGQPSWTPDWRAWKPFFTSSVQRYVRNPERPLNPKYVRHIRNDEYRHRKTSYRHYPSNDRVYGPLNRRNLDKYTAYRLMRKRVIYERAYMGQTYIMFTGPTGFLP